MVFPLYIMMNYEASTEPVRYLQTQLSPACWKRRIERAQYRLSVVESLRRQHPCGPLSRAGVRAAAPGVLWANARRWWAWYHTRAGEPWERMMDRRLPERPWETPAPWKSVVRALGAQQPAPGLESIREALVAEFGPEAALSDATLRRILQAAGLAPHTARYCQREEPVTELSGGGGLVLLLAALIKRNALPAMAEGVLTLAKGQLVSDGPVQEAPAGHDEQGRLTATTATYNHNRLASRGERSLYQSVDEQRADKDLSRLRLSAMSGQTLEQHLRCLVALPLVTNRRGVVGLNDPAGAWLEILTPVAYKAATVEKALNELKWLGAGEVLWERHARSWLSWSQHWAGEGPWRQAVYYVDSTQDPWWTQRFAKSAKVSRSGRVQPCLSRTVLSSGPGVPIIAEVVSGKADLGEQMFTLMNTADALLGEGGISRVTVVDAEGCQRELLRRFLSDPHHDVVSVLKGSLARGKTLEVCGEWMAYRERDQLREALVNLEPEKADGMRLRVVEMGRADSEHRPPTWFITTACVERLSTQAVADAYLNRWPAQEDLFRRGRHGGGLERSHGYGVTPVTNVAIVGKRETAAGQQQRAEQGLAQAEQAQCQAGAQLQAARARLKARQQAHPGELNGRHKLGVRQARQQHLCPGHSTRYHHDLLENDPPGLA
jgi:hypothetical protein